MSEPGIEALDDVVAASLVFGEHDENDLSLPGRTIGHWIYGLSG